MWLWLGLAVTAAAPVGRSEPFRVMTYNIHHGEGADGQLDLARIAAVIRQEEADVVALQEVDKGVARTQRRDLPAELAALTGMTCLFTNNFAYQGGEYGNAVLARFPVVRWTNTHLRMLRPNEQRGVLQAVLRVADRPLLLLNTHIDYHRDDAERLQNVAEFKELLGRYPDLPVVFCGDFNDGPESRTYAAMAERFEDVWLTAGRGSGLTITSTRPAKRIDYVWISKGAPLRVRRAWVTQTLASDHLPLTVELEWR